ncbi:hypothetical protein BC941DRAFT_435859 [Chlamydoabsidia padenii]|nr:hypothetical protein BC941DRAFT_435859 [Chlamydoabsidia padenii]
MNPPSPQQSHVISQQVFGSSKKLQFIGISPMDSLLTAIDHQTQQTKSATHPRAMSIESLLDTNGETSGNSNKRQYPSEYNNHGPTKNVRRKPNSATTVPVLTTNNNDTTTSISPAASVSHIHPKSSRMTTLTCYHASVAQKSYGSEKRFLCPPPVVRVQSPSGSTSTLPSLTMAVINENGDRHLEQHAALDDDQCTFKYLHVTGTAKAKQFSLRISIPLDTTYLSPSQQQQQQQQHTTFLSDSISIISKPSKKTAKTRNVSTCILANRPISLFNRINSQTVRTKYMTSENNQLCAKNGTWSPFEIIILNQPQHYQTVQRPSSTTSSASNNNVIPLIYGSELILRDTQTGVRSQPVVIRKVDKGRIVPGAYGPVSQMQKIALQLVTRSQTNSNRRPHPSMYLSAMGVNEATGGSTGSSGNTSSSTTTPAHSPHTTLLDYSGSRMVPEGLDAYEKVDDYLCWTIVGISTFEYSYYDNQRQLNDQHQTTPQLTPEINLPSSPLSSPSPSSPSSTTTTSSSPVSITRSTQPSSSSSSSSSSSFTLHSLSTTMTSNKLKSRCLTPFPTLTSIQYQPSTHTLDIIGQHLMQAVPSPKLLELWLGSHHGPLLTTLQPQPEQPHQTHLIVDIPSTQDLIVANHDRLVISPGGDHRTLELPLFLVREDGVVYHSGKALSWEMMLVNSDAGRWSIVDVRQ